MATRREILGAATGTLCVSLSGCLSSVSPPQNTTPDNTPVPFDVPSAEECSQTPRPMPEPVAGYEPRPYPDPPVEFGETAAEEFALAYERVILYNDWLAENISEDTESFSVDVTASSTEEAGNGHLVGLDWSASETTEDGGIGEAWGAIVYYIGPRVGVRAYPDAESIHDVSLQSCDCTVLGTVYCQ